MKKIIEREWPELQDWPFNTPFGFPKIVLDARRTVRKIRSKFAS